MEVAHAETETGDTRYPALITIETNQPKQLCPGCGSLLIEAHFWSQPSGIGKNRGVKRTRWCVSCRTHGGRLLASTDTESPQQRLRRAMIEAIRSRNRSVHHTYRDDWGQRRCKSCHSTIYRHLTLIRAAGHPAGYLITWICWFGGHEVLERWRFGSPVRGRFPTSKYVPYEPPPKPKTPQQIPLNQMPTHIPGTVTPKVPYPISRLERSINMKTVQQDVEVYDGCNTECKIVRYRDADDPNSPVYLKRDHSWQTHNAYVSTEHVPLTVFEWNGLRMDFDQHTIHVDGLELSNSRLLTPKEWSLLKALIRHAGRVALKETLLQAVWGDAYTSEDHLLRVNMARMRAKLDPNDANRFVKTVPGVGYRIGQIVKPVIEPAPPTYHGTVPADAVHHNGNGVTVLP